MMGEEKHETREVFTATLALTTPEERAHYLDEVCRGKPELRQRVGALLRAHNQAGGFLEPTVQVAPAGDFLVEHAGVMIGRYKLLQEIGEGGFGQVFLAEQQEPVQRKVAIKIIKAGMDTKEVIARFEVERQALALMDHPNIARVLDAGATEAGRPYFVMELVRGIPLTEYCDRNNLPMAERLELCMQVCQAVQHAHQKAIIHRDLKPTNILVTIIDGKPVPKIIDFGVAKALGQKLTEKTLFTAFEQIIGTPAYMSPEQAELSGMDVDTRSDIYSLGVLLYELLTGVTPFDGETLRKAALDEVRRMIRETEPPKPSTRLRTLGDKLTDVAQHRQTEPSALPRLVHGDLDWIVMKALEKDRARRYETADALLADIQRHLDHQPVKASPPGTLYRAHKFVRRHRMGVALAASVTVVLIAGLVVSVIGFTAARRERDRAEHMAQQESMQRERAEAGAEAARNEKELAAANLRRAEISLIQRHLDKSEVGPALALLEKQRPTVNMGDSRSLEWRLLWRRAHQGHRSTLRGHEGPVSAVAFLPSGILVASAGADGTVRLWDMASGKERAPLVRNQSPIVCLAVSPDAKTLAWGDDRGVLSIWDLPQGRLRASVPAHFGPVKSVAFSPDSQLIATCAWNATARLWDAGTAERTGPDLAFGNTEPASEPWMNAVAFSPDGQTVAGGVFGSVALWDLKTRQVRVCLHRHRHWIANLAFTPDGKTLISGGNDSVVKLWDVTAAREKGELQSKIRQPTCLALSPDGTTVAIGGACGTIVVRDLASGQAKTYGHVGRIYSVSFSPDGRTLASAGADGTVKLWDLTQQQNLPPLHGRQTLVWSVAYSPDGKLLACAGEPNPEFWYVSSRHLLRTIPERGGMVIAFSPKGNVVAEWNWLWDVTTSKRLSSLPLGGGLAVAFTPDGKTLIEGWGHGGAEEGQIRIWDWKAGQRRAVLRGHRGWVISLAVSPDGHTFASASGNNPEGSEVILWKLPSGRRIRTLEHGYISVAFSPDGKMLATGSKRGGIALWDPATGNLLKDMVGHIPFQRHLAFAPDGKTIVSCNMQGGVTLWDVGKGMERATLARSDHSVYAVAFSPDGQTFATGGREGTLEIWRTASEAEVQAQSAWFDARLRLARELQANAKALHLGLHPDEALGARLQAENLYHQLAAEFPQRTDYRYSRLANQASLVALLADHDSLLTETNHWLRLADEAVKLACRDTNGYSGLLRPLLLNRLKLLQSVNRLSAAATGKPSAGAPGTEALAVIRRVLGPEHPETLRLMGDLAIVLRAEGKLADAESICRELIACNDPRALNRLAWRLATAQDPKQRDGQWAVKFAEQAVAATGRTNTMILDTLATAYAEVGQFTNAIRVQKECLALPDPEHFRQGYEARLRLFESNSPYRQP